MHRPLVLLLLLPFVACNTIKQTTKTRTLDTLTVSSNNPMNIYRETAPVTWDILDTRVALTFNFKEKTANGRAWISIVPYCCTQDSLVLDAKDMKIDTVAWVNNGRIIPTAYRYEKDQLTIKKRVERNPGSVEPAEINQLYITYKAMPYADTTTTGSAAINDSRGLYFINTDRKIPAKPVQIWTQGESESNSHWLPTIDKPNERFTLQVELTIPDTFQTLGNGALISSRPAGNGLRTDIWKMDKPIQTYAAMFAIGKYAIIKDTWRGKEVNYYVEPEFAPYARKIFQHTPEMLDYFSAITGVEYPWNKYSQVISRDYVSGAMENTSASLFGEFMNQTDREIEDKNSEGIVAHELFHQWFGDYVTFESWSNLTLSESFADYSEQLWERHYYGNAKGDEVRMNALNKYLEGSQWADPELVRFHYRDREDMFDRISYEKGGAILNYLHGLLGDDLFYLSVHNFLAENALKSAEATQWRLAVEEASGRDWTWFFNEFYNRAGHPVLDVKYKYNDAAQELSVMVRQRSSPDSSVLYQLPLKTGIVNEGKTVIEDWKITRRNEVFTYKYQNGKRPLVIPDYYHWLPGELIENKKPEQWLAQLHNTADYANKRRAISYVSRGNATDSSTKAVFRDALNDTIAGIRTLALERLAERPLQELLRQQVIYLAVQDPANRVRTAAFKCLGAWRATGAKDEMLQATDDRSYAVSGAALNALNELDASAAYDKAKTLIDTDPKADQKKAVWTIMARRAQPGDFNIFREQATKVYGKGVAELAEYLSTYLAGVTDERTFFDGLSLLDQLFHSELSTGNREFIFSVAIEQLSAAGRRDGSKLNATTIKAHKAAAEKVIAPWLDSLLDKTNNQIRLDEHLH